MAEMFYFPESFKSILNLSAREPVHNAARPRIRNRAKTSGQRQRDENEEARSCPDLPQNEQVLQDVWAAGCWNDDFLGSHISADLGEQFK